MSEFDNISVALKLRDDGFDTQLRKSSRGVEDFGETAERSGRKASKSFDGVKDSWLGIEDVVKGGVVALAIGAAINQASKLEQAVGGSASVFKGAAGEVADFAQGAADAVGLSEEAALSLTSRIGGSLKGYGFSVDEAAAKSIELTKLGADLAATFGGTTSEAVEALGSALRGEFDPLERFAVALTADQIAAKAVAMGLAASTSNVDAHAKAVATLALIQERSADSSGQFSRELDTAAGSVERAHAKLQDAQADLGANFLPLFAKGAGFVGSFSTEFEKLPSSVQIGATAVAGFLAFRGPLGKFGDAAKGMFTDLRSSDSLLSSSIGKSAALGAAGVAVGFAWQLVADHIAEVDQQLSSTLSTVKQLNADDTVADTQRHLQAVRSEIKGMQHEFDNSKNPLDVLFRRDLGAGIDQFSGYESQLQLVTFQTNKLAAATGLSLDEANKWLSGQLAAGHAYASSAEAIKGYAAATGKATDEAGRLRQAAEQQAEAVSKISSSFFGLVDASKGVTDAQRKITEAERGRVEAGRKVVDAQRDYEASLRSIDEAQRGYQAAVRGVTDAERSHQAAIRSVGEAERNRVESLHSVEDAQRGVIDAQRALDEALRGPGTDDQISLERAELGVKQAKKRLAGGGFEDNLDRQSAKLDLRQAEADLVRLKAELAGKPAAAQTALEAAQRQLDSARHDAIAADQAVTDAQYALVTSSQGVADARHEVATAEIAVRDAVRDSQTALAGISDAQAAYTEAGTKIEEAKDGMVRAAVDLAGKQGDVNKAFHDGAAGIDPLIAQLDALKGKYPELAGAIQPYLDQLRALKDLSGASTAGAPDQASIDERAIKDLQRLGIDTSSQNYNPGAPMQILRRIAENRGLQVPENISLDDLEKLLGIQGRARGGPVVKGIPYIVGEQGPELRTFDHAGSIVNARDTAQLLSARGGSSRPLQSGPVDWSTNVHMTIVQASRDTDAVFYRKVMWSLEGQLTGRPR